MMEYLVVAALSLILSCAELVSRYRDEPGRLFGIRVVYFYMALNIAIGCSALYLLKTFVPSDLMASVDATQTEAQQAIYRVLIAGFGGAAFFRSSIARAKLGDYEIGIGPSFAIDALLAAVDRQIDRARAMERTSKISRIMRPLPVGFAANQFADYCIASLQNMSAADEKTLRSRIKTVVWDEDGDQRAVVPAIIIGFVLAEYTGIDLLEKATAQLSEEVERARAAADETEAAFDEDEIAAALASGFGPAAPSLAGGAASGA